MMSRDFAFVLDESLARLKNGESLESCLADYPEHSSQLAPLLLTFLSLQTLNMTQPPSPDAVLSGRQRFLTEAAKLRKAEATVQPGLRSRIQEWFSHLRVPVHQQRLAWATVTAMAALLVFVLVGGSAVLASADSLPGDPLYPIKRIAETVQLSLTFDPSAHFELERELHERRQQEIQALVMRGREAEISFEGVVQSIHPGTLSMSGYPPIIVDNRTTIEGNMGVGAVVQVKAQSESNGGLRAVNIKVLVPAPNPTAILTPMPTETAMPVATATLEATEPPPPTPTATSTVTPTPTRPTPTRTASPTVTLTPSPTPTTSPTATPKTEPRPIRWTGCIQEQISEQVWVIGSQKVVITGDTKIDGELAVGHMAEVVTEPDGDHHAQTIKILSAELFDFAGIIQEIGTPEWTIGGFKVTVDPKQTRIISPRALRLGDYVRVNANRRCIGPHLANIIELPQTIKWSGTVKQINGDLWMIDSSEVLVNNDTKLIGEPGVGSLVEIVAVIQPDGPPLALSITVRPTPTPTPRPTATFTPTPTPTSTPPPTVIATATPQSSPGTSVPNTSQ